MERISIRIAAIVVCGAALVGTTRRVADWAYQRNAPSPSELNQDLGSRSHQPRNDRNAPPIVGVPSVKLELAHGQGPTLTRLNLISEEDQPTDENLTISQLPFENSAPAGPTTAISDAAHDIAYDGDDNAAPPVLPIPLEINPADSEVNQEESQASSNWIELQLVEPAPAFIVPQSVVAQSVVAQSEIAQSEIAQSDAPVPTPAPTLPTPESIVEDAGPLSQNESAPLSNVDGATSSTSTDSFASTPTPSARNQGTWQRLELDDIELNSQSATSQGTQRSARHATIADQRIGAEVLRMGFELAQRQAYYASRARLLETLHIVARSLDEQTAGSDHSAALSRGLKAMEEAADFMLAEKQTNGDRLSEIAATHDTPILQHQGKVDLSARKCLREYLTYAEQEMKRGVADDRLASQALYGLGRLQVMLDTDQKEFAFVRANQAIMLHQTALLVDSTNFAAANELGVLLARHGQYEAALQSLEHAVRTAPREKTSWSNLASLHERLGNAELAAKARSQASRLDGVDGVTDSLPPLAARPKIDWVEPQAFGATTTAGESVALEPAQVARDLSGRRNAVKPNARRKPTILSTPGGASDDSTESTWFWPRTR